MKDKFQDQNYGIDAIPMHAEAVTPNDSELLPHVVRRVHIGVGGDLAVKIKGSPDSVIFKNLPDGSEKTGAFTQVLATGTTCTDIIGEW